MYLKKISTKKANSVKNVLSAQQLELDYCLLMFKRKRFVYDGL